MKTYLIDASWFIACFLLIQLVCTSAAMLIWNDMLVNPTALSVSLGASSLITILLYWWRKWWTENISAVREISFPVVLLLCLTAVFNILPSDALSELLGIKANETQERLMMQIMQSPLSFLVIAVLVPLTEEVVFRGAFLRTLLNRFQSDRGVWCSILASAALFGLVHGNIAQFVHATIIGIFLGWLYYKTRSILPGVIFHFANNAIVFLFVKLVPETTDSMLETFDGNYPLYAASLIASIVLLAILIRQLNNSFTKGS